MADKQKKTVVLIASPKPDRYSNRVVRMLIDKGYEVVPVGYREAEIEGVRILKGRPDIKDVDTLTLYLNPENQIPFYDYISALKPRRVIFNPGTENPDLQHKLNALGIVWENACTLVMLSTGQF